MTGEAAEDRRVRRTRTALNDAFIALVQERPYDELQVQEIADRAGVGRSTFYEHFQNKDELLFASLYGVFEALADAATIHSYDAERLQFWTDSVWTNRRLVRVLLSGQSRPYLSRHLAGLIETRLARGMAIRPLSAAGLAEAQLGLLLAWITGHDPASPALVAETLRRLTLGSVEALTRPQ